jgi:hypothetical protein
LTGALRPTPSDAGCLEKIVAGEEQVCATYLTLLRRFYQEEPMTFAFDVALSFAGEQRSDVEQVANCLKAAGLNVFYDVDQQADLWGKDLYVHLSDVYQNQARYCIIFASKEYREKNWTNHERQNAQARALREKGNEYILPVRFDDTEIPGIPPTIGYLDFRREGAAGVCKAFLQKFGITQSPARISEMSCDSSPRALIQSLSLNTVAFLPVLESSWKANSATLLVEPDDPTDGPFLDKLRSQPRHIIVAFGNNAAIGSIAGVEHIVSGGQQRWKLEFKDLESDFSQTMEMGTTGTSAEQFAEIRANRIFLNENRPEKSQDFNKVMYESLVQGHDAKLNIEGSPFAPLYREYGKEPNRFLQIAWITAAMQAKVSNTVASVDSLKLRLNESVLTIKFRGTRARRYSNVAPHVIDIEGSINLRQ